MEQNTLFFFFLPPLVEISRRLLSCGKKKEDGSLSCWKRRREEKKGGGRRRRRRNFFVRALAGLTAAGRPKKRGRGEEKFGGPWGRKGPQNNHHYLCVSKYSAQTFFFHETSNDGMLKNRPSLTISSRYQQNLLCRFQINLLC